MRKILNLIAIVRDEQRFVFMYDDESHETLLAVLGTYAADPELDFTWHDAAVLAQRIRDRAAADEAAKERQKADAHTMASDWEFECLDSPGTIPLHPPRRFEFPDENNRAA